MNQKTINKIITIISNILQFILVIFSLVSIFALFKEFANFELKGLLNREKYECFGPNYIEEIKKEFKGTDMDLEMKKMK